MISRLLVQIITKWSQNLQGGSWDRDEPLHKKNQPKTQRITRISWGKEAKEGFPKTAKTSIRGTRDSREFSSRLDDREANHGVPKPPKRKLRTQRSPKERKSIYDQRMNENTRELLKRVLNFIQIHRDLQRTSPIQELDLHPFIHPLKFVDLAII